MDSGRQLSTTHPTLRESTEPDGSPCSLGTSENIRGDDDEAHRISLLEMAIEKVTAERDQLKTTLREQQRAVETLESCIIAKTDTKEKELRHFLAPRPVLSDSETPPVQQPVSTIAPILSTVPAVRPVPTLIGGTTKCADGLLGPAHLPSTGPSATHTGTSNLSSRSDSRKLTNGPSILSNESDGGVPLYSKVFIDSCVNLVLARLRRAQNNCHALVATSQTDLQSFTFTQNSTFIDHQRGWKRPPVFILSLIHPVGARCLKWIDREFTDRKVRGSNPTSASRLPLSRLGQPDSIPALVLPSGGTAARHRKGVTAEHLSSSLNCFIPSKRNGGNRPLCTSHEFLHSILMR
ncbi:hypothetical protein CSKR_113441 [Clonorchis sinensis]|uniref:Uncharacterized protein n=1 Tax=Clonorchis sinensis TaxID=79923 RepID=A0A419QCF8_CLOSI|nr:hypothetical protein CSKR_113441 [Clonorchis sinensis]